MQFREIALLTFALRLALLRSSTVKLSPVTTLCLTNHVFPQTRIPKTDTVHSLHSDDSS